MNWRIGGFFAALLAGVVVVMLRMPASAGGLWLTILWAAWIAAVVWAFTRPSFSLLFVAVMAAMLLFVILPATDALFYGLTTIGGNDYAAGVVRALEIATLAQCGMLAGAVAARGLWPVPSIKKLSPRLLPSRLDKGARWSVSVGVLAVIAFSALGGASLQSFLVYTTSSGYGTFARAATGDLGYLSAAEDAAGLAVILLPLRLNGGRSGRSFRWSVLLVAALATLVLLGGGQRGRFFVPVFAAGLVWLKTSEKRLPPRRLALIGVLVLILIGGVVGVARGAASSRRMNLATILTASVGSSNDLFLPLAGVASSVPSQIPYLDGRSYLEVGTFLIPRALWSGKPQGSIARLTTEIDPGNSGLAFPEFGEMYANFGLPGVILGSLFLGVLIELISRRFARSADIRESVFLAVCGAVLLDIFTRGAIAPMLTSFAGLLVAAAVICRRKSHVLSEAPKPVQSESIRSENTRHSVVPP